MLDLLRLPLLERFFHWRHARTFLQIPLLFLSGLMVWHGLFGPSLAPKNLATTLTWIHFRGALVLLILLAGNFFCLACPFMLPRQIARRFITPRRNWPRRLRTKWLSLALFILVLFAYELFDLWSTPFWTACLIVAYFVAALLVDSVFKHASFCKFVCPIGQFNFVASTLSPFEVKVRDMDVCSACKTKDCIRGRREPSNQLVVLQRGCELALFQPRKAGNMDCTFCLDCIHACPHDNVGIISRPPAAELIVDPMRSGVGYFSRRKDLAGLVLVFTFGALLNAFGMVSPVYALERSLSQLLGINHEAPILGFIFFLFLVAEPVLLLGIAGWLTIKWGGVNRTLLPVITRYAYTLVPLGFGMWLAHYGFHFLTGLYTFIPVLQNAIASSGWALFGEPNWRLVGFPTTSVYPIELGFLGLGLLGSALVSYRLAEGDSKAAHPMRIFGLWTSVSVVVFLAALWLMMQPMEMRSTLLGIMK